MLDVYKSLVEELSAGRPAVIADIIRMAGSVPRSLGATFLVRQDGSLRGSIGGGVLEAMVIEKSGDVMGRNAASLMEIRLSGQEVAGTEMICGGNVDVLIQAVTPENPSVRRVWEAVLRLLEKGGRGILVKGPLPEPGRDAAIDLGFIKSDREVVGAIEPGALTAILDQTDSILDEKLPRIITLDENRGKYVLTPLYSNPTAIIFGGGHISLKLAPLLVQSDFDVVVVDDREEFAGPDRFPQARQLLVCDFEKCFDKLEFTPETYSIIVTRGHLHDKTVLAKVLDLPGRYIGMIGSRRKKEMIYQALIREGASLDALAKVYSPIGLDIGAETPEEIAICIAAELIKVRAEGLKLLKNWKV